MCQNCIALDKIALVRHQNFEIKFITRCFKVWIMWNWEQYGGFQRLICFEEKPSEGVHENGQNSNENFDGSNKKIEALAGKRQQRYWNVNNEKEQNLL